MDELARTINAQTDAMVATMQMAMMPRYGTCVMTGDFPMEVLIDLYETLLKKKHLLPETMMLFGYKRRLSKYFHSFDKQRYPTVDISLFNGPPDLKLPLPVMVVLLFNGIFHGRASSQAKAAVTKANKRARGEGIEEQEARLRSVKRERVAMQVAGSVPSVPEEPATDAYEAGGF